MADPALTGSDQDVAETARRRDVANGSGHWDSSGVRGASNAGQRRLTRIASGDRPKSDILIDGVMSENG
jgi:hypothetical protein